MAAKQRQKMEQPEVVNYASSKEPRQRTSAMPHSRSCKYCGDTHPKGKCPAYGKTCAKCQKKNHFTKVCQSTIKQSERQRKPTQNKRKPRHQNVHQMEQCSSEHNPDELSTDESIYKVQTTRTKTQYFAEVLVTANDKKKGTLIKFQLDTGATCSTISLEDYQKLTNQAPQQSNTRLRLYDHSVIQPVGSTTLRCEVNGTNKKVHFEVVKDAHTSLLSGKACQALKLIHFNEESILHVSTSGSPDLSQEQILQDYQDVFTGLGKLPGVYHIEIDPNTKQVQENPRRVPIPIKEELKHKIDELEAMNVLAKVTQPTPWISNMVVVKKPNKLRVCLDPLHLNKGIIRNHYPTPTVEDVAPRLTKAKVFSLVDAKDGFLQVVLGELSSYLTPFWTPFGRYRWLCNSIRNQVGALTNAWKVSRTLKSSTMTSSSMEQVILKRKPQSPTTQPLKLSWIDAENAGLNSTSES